MANWQYKLHLKDLWDSYDSGTVSITWVAEKTVQRLKSLGLPPDFTHIVNRIIDDLNGAETIEEYDAVFNDIWDLGDTPLPTPPGQMIRKLCWVETF